MTGSSTPEKRRAAMRAKLVQMIDASSSNGPPKLRFKRFDAKPTAGMKPRKIK